MKWEKSGSVYKISLNDEAIRMVQGGIEEFLAQPRWEFFLKFCFLIILWPRILQHFFIFALFSILTNGREVESKLHNFSKTRDFC